MPGGQHADDLVALAEPRPGAPISRVHVEDRAGEFHLGRRRLGAGHGREERHLEDGAGVEADKGDFDEQPFFRVGDVLGEGEGRGEGWCWERGQGEDSLGEAAGGICPGLDGGHDDVLSLCRCVAVLLICESLTANAQDKVQPNSYTRSDNL